MIIILDCLFLTSLAFCKQPVDVCRGLDYECQLRSSNMSSGSNFLQKAKKKRIEQNCGRGNLRQRELANAYNLTKHVSREIDRDPTHGFGVTLL